VVAWYVYSGRVAPDADLCVKSERYFIHNTICERTIWSRASRQTDAAFTAFYWSRREEDFIIFYLRVFDVRAVNVVAMRGCL
jgi:hypothetical protein